MRVFYYFFILCSIFLMNSSGVYSQTVYAWGLNQYGQLGDGTKTAKNVPTQILTGYNWKKFSIGLYTTFAIREDSTLWVWGGYPSYPVLGNGTVDTTSNVPIQTAKFATWIDVSCRVRTVLAIRSDSTLWAWGYGSAGLLGDGDASYHYSFDPIQIGTDNDWALVSTGNLSSAAIKRDGSLWIWGGGWSGPFGLGAGIFNIPVPTRLGTDNNWKKIVSSQAACFAIKTDGTLWAWGSYLEHLGFDTTGNVYYPKQIGKDNHWVDISTFYWHALALKKDSSLWAWGDNQFGQFGDGTTTLCKVPIRIGNAKWKSIGAGSKHSAGIQADGTVWAWGANSQGQLGNGTMVDSNIPIQIGTNKKWVSVNCGNLITLGLLSINPIISSASQLYPPLICENEYVYYINIINKGEDTLKISNLSFEDYDMNDFQFDEPLPINIAPYKTRKLKFIFHPKTIGLKTATAVITNNDNSNTLFRVPISIRKDSIDIKPTISEINLGLLCPNETKDTSFKVISQSTIPAGFYATKTTDIDLSNHFGKINNGEEKTINLHFKGRTEPGEFEETVSVIDSACGYVHEIIVKGIIGDVDLEVDDVSVSAQVGGSEDVSIQIVNNSSRNVTINEMPILDPPFSIVNTVFPLVIPADSSVFIVVRYSPTTAGESKINMQIFGLPCDIEKNIEITGNATEKEMYAQEPVIAGLMCENSKEFDVIVTNTGENDWNITGLSLDGTNQSDFIILETAPLEILKKSTKVIKMQFSPQSSGNKEAELTIETDNPNFSTMSVQLNASKDSVRMDIEEKIVDLGFVFVNEPKDTNITINNSGTTYNTAYILHSGEFVPALDRISLSANSFQTMKIAFAGSDVPFDIDEIITIKDTICNTERNVRILLKVVEQNSHPRIYAGLYQIPDLICNNSLSHTLYISNLGSSTLTITAININGINKDDFSINATFPMSMGPFSSDSLYFNFIPNSAGIKKAELVIISNADNYKSLKIYLQAKREIIDFSYSKTELDFGDMFVNEQANQTFTLTNTSTISTTFKLTSSPNFTVTPDEITLFPNASSLITVTYLGSTNETEIQGFVNIWETTCNKSSVLNAKGSVLANIPMLTGTMKTNSLSGFPGDVVELTITLENAKNLVESGVAGFSAELRYNPTLLFNSNYAQTWIDDKTSMIHLTNLPAQSGELTKVKFIVGLGNAETSDLVLTNITASGGKADIQTENGIFTLLGVCREGGTRLINSSKSAGIIQLLPNPVVNNLDISLELIEIGETKLELYNIFGEKVKTILSENVTNIGSRKLTANLNEFGSGQYMLIFTSPTICGMKKVVVVR